MKGNVVVAYSWCKLQYGCAINNDAGKNMQCKNAFVKCSVTSPMFKCAIAEVGVLRNKFVQKETEEGEPENGSEIFFIMWSGLYFLNFSSQNK